MPLPLFIFHNISFIEKYSKNIREHLCSGMTSFNILFLIGIFYPSGKPISPHLLRYKGFAVGDHSFILRASHLRQLRLVNNPGQMLYRL